jgi:hypothetical protein
MKNNSDHKPVLTGRERVRKDVGYEQVDRVPVDLGGTLGTGAQVSVIAGLRRALGLDEPGTPVKVVEIYQMLGEVAADLRGALGIDVVNLPGPKNHFGFADADYKPWRTFKGTDVLVPGKFNTEPEPNGDILQYPQGDKSAPPSGRMPKGGFYFDDIIRQEPIDEAKLDPADNLEDFALIGEDDLNIYEQRARELYDNTDLAITAGFPGTAFGDVALVPAAFLKHTKGIRDIEEWYISTPARPRLRSRTSNGSTRPSATGCTWSGSMVRILPPRTRCSAARTRTGSFICRSVKSSTIGFTPTQNGNP